MAENFETIWNHFFSHKYIYTQTYMAMNKSIKI